MKKFCIIFLLSIIISLTALGFSGVLGTEQANDPTRYASNIHADDFLRMHIRADSNEESAQKVKYKVRDEVVAYLTPLVADYQTSAQAMQSIENNLTAIERVATAALSSNGFSYGAYASVKTERFPTRVYGEYTLPSGEYSALIIELGSGKGDNWWCVVYPPLCFTATPNVVYKSKILEIIRKWKNG